MVQVRFLAGLMLAVPAVAHAEPAPSQLADSFRLSWSAPHDCPQESDVRQRIQRLLNESKLAPAATPLEVVARVNTSPEGFRLELTLGSSAVARSRALLAPTCAELAHATVLIVALAIDPSLAANPDPDTVPVTPAAGIVPDEVRSPPACAGLPAISACELPTTEPVMPAATISAPSASAPNITKADVPRAQSRFALVAGSGLAVGALPQAWPGVVLGGAYRQGMHWLELSASGAFAVSGPSSDGTGANFMRAFLAPRYCGRVAGALGTLGVCGSFELGASRAAGFGVDYPSTRWNPWFAPGIGAQASIALSSGAELSLMGDLLFVVTRTRFELDGALRFRPNLVVPAIRLALAAGI